MVTFIISYLEKVWSFMGKLRMKNLMGIFILWTGIKTIYKEYLDQAILREDAMYLIDVKLLQRIFQKIKK